MDRTALASQFGYRFVYARFLYSAFNCVIPYALLTLFSVLLITAHRSRRRRRAAFVLQRRHSSGVPSVGRNGSIGSGSRRDNERSTTLVVVAIVVTFGVCNLPDKILSLVASMLGSDWKTNCSHPIYIAYRTCNMLELANSIGNFIVYCALREQFRRSLSIRGRRHLRSPTPSPRILQQPQQQPNWQPTTSEVRNEIRPVTSTNSED
jgi:hypothetical protein